MANQFNELFERQPYPFYTEAPWENFMTLAEADRQEKLAGLDTSLLEDMKYASFDTDDFINFTNEWNTRRNELANKIATTPGDPNLSREINKFKSELQSDPRRFLFEHNYEQEAKRNAYLQDMAKTPGAHRWWNDMEFTNFIGQKQAGAGLIRYDFNGIEKHLDPYESAQKAIGELMPHTAEWKNGVYQRNVPDKDGKLLNPNLPVGDIVKLTTGGGYARLTQEDIMNAARAVAPQWLRTPEGISFTKQLYYEQLGMPDLYDMGGEPTFIGGPQGQESSINLDKFTEQAAIEYITNANLDQLQWDGKSSYDEQWSDQSKDSGGVIQQIPVRSQGPATTPFNDLPTNYKTTSKAAAVGQFLLDFLDNPWENITSDVHPTQRIAGHIKTGGAYEQMMSQFFEGTKKILEAGQYQNKTWDQLDEDTREKFYEGYLNALNNRIIRPPNELLVENKDRKELSHFKNLYANSLDGGNWVGGMAGTPRVWSAETTGGGRTVWTELDSNDAFFEMTDLGAQLDNGAAYARKFGPRNMVGIGGGYEVTVKGKQYIIEGYQDDMLLYPEREYNPLTGTYERTGESILMSGLVASLSGAFYGRGDEGSGVGFGMFPIPQLDVYGEVRPMFAFFEPAVTGGSYDDPEFDTNGFGRMRILYADKDGNPDWNKAAYIDSGLHADPLGIVAGAYMMKYNQFYRNKQ